MTARQFGCGGRGTPRQDPQFYSQVQDEGVALPQEIALNFVGGGVTAADDAANNRTNVTIPLGAGLNPPANPGENNMVAWGLNGNLQYGAQLFTDGTYLGVGGAAATLATIGAIRLPNAHYIYSRNLLNTADILLIGATGLNVVQIGNVNSDAVTLYADGNLIATFDSTFMALGTNPAQTGGIRLPNANYIYSRNLLNTADILVIGATGANAVQIGGTNATAVTVYADGNLIATFDTTFMSIGTTPAQTGLIRVPNNQAMHARDNADAADIRIFDVTVSNELRLGGSNGVNTHLGMSSTAGGNGNVSFGSIPANWQNMRKGMFLVDATAAPTGNPAGGGFIYCNAGAGTWRGSGGTITAFGPADPHCPRCHRDWVNHSWNPGVGNKEECTKDSDPDDWEGAICWHCLVDELKRLGADPGSFMVRHKRGGRNELAAA